MIPLDPNEETDGAVALPQLVRLCRVRESDIGDTLAQFHAWTVRPRCAVGDGSSIYHETLAIIERIHNGEVFYAEPHQVRFCKPNVKVHTPLPASASDETGVKP